MRRRKRQFTTYQDEYSTSLFSTTMTKHRKKVKCRSSLRSSRNSLDSICHHFNLYLKLKTDLWGFPGDPVVKNLPADAGDTYCIPGLGRSHIPWETVREPQLLNPREATTEACTRSLCSATREAMQWERTATRELLPLSTTRGNLRHKRRPSAARNESLGWCKSNHGFYTVEVCHLVLKYILN